MRRSDPTKSERARLLASRLAARSTASGTNTATIRRPLDQPAATIRIVIADDHPIVREGFSRVLEHQDGLEVVGHASDGIEALALVRELDPDILMLDVTMPRLSGLEVLRELSKTPSACRVIMMATALDREQFLEAMQLGARGIVMKNTATALLVKSIPTVMSGQYWIGRDNVSELVTHLRRAAAATQPETPKAKFGLTKRELQIVAAVVAAYSNKEIAERYSLSEDTVKHHLSNIFDKLGVSNRLEVALFAINHQLVEPGALAL